MSMEVLGRHWRELLEKQNVLNTTVATKFKDGIDTKVPAIVVYVKKKVAAAELSPEHLVPKEIEGVITDVVELAPATWQADKTTVSQLNPERQKRLLGVQEKPIPKVAASTHLTLKTPSGASDLIKWASAIQDQLNCGSCTAFGSIGVGEAAFRIKYNDMNACPKLSESHLFFCAGGTCDGGNTVVAVLNQFMKGVCTEACLPYKDQDQACGAGICSGWWLLAKKLAGWQSITGPAEIKALLDTIPLNTTMAVHQSFFNYTGGVYKNLGPQDPIAGYHDIGCFGYSDPLLYKIIRNSWGAGWGQNCIINGIPRPGYCLIDPGELDPEMWELIPDGPVPEPPPTPSPCSLGNAIAKFESAIAALLGREGRFYYRNPGKSN